MQIPYILEAFDSHLEAKPNIYMLHNTYTLTHRRSFLSCFMALSREKKRERVRERARTCIQK